ncbi:MAG: type IV secretory system conjugative DNA transfer family protein [Coriobacteriales bacterium]|nr:type IV secretory system conjugative DNA transfer family protein [Coriobacteriales bacterium]
MQIVSYAEAVSKKTVTSNPHSAGLVPYTLDDIKGGKASGLVCGGGPSSVTWCTPPGKHAVVVGRTGAGKTRSCLEPTVIVNGTRRGKGEHPKSMVIVDSKRTMWRETAPYLKSQGYEVKVVDLMSSKSEGRWSPLTEAFRIIKETGDVALAEASLSKIKAATIASVHSEKDSYWETVSWNLISAVSMALCLTEDEEPSLADVCDAIHDENKLRWLADHLGDETPKAILDSFDLTHAKTTWSCVKSVVSAMLGFYATSTGRHVAASSNIDFRTDFFRSGWPTCIYVISPDNNQLCSNYTVHLIEYATASYMDEFERRNLEGTDLFGLCFIVDEFARLPRCEQILALMATGRSRNCTAYLTLQSFSQFLERGLYTRAEANVVLEQAAVNIYMSNISHEIASDAEFKSGGAIDVGHMLRLGPGDAYVCVAGKPMVGTHMEPLEAYGRHLDLHAAPAPRKARVSRDDVVERMLDLHDADECAGRPWDIGAERLLDDMIDTILAKEDAADDALETPEEEVRARPDGDEQPQGPLAHDDLDLQSLQEELDALFADDN